MMLSNAYSVLVAVGILWTAYSVGRPLAALFGVDEDDRLASTLWNLTLGLVACGLFLAGLGLVGQLTESWVRLLTLGGTLWGLRVFCLEPDQWRDPRVIWRRWRNTDTLEDVISGPPGWVNAAMFTAAGVCAFASFLGALAPPVAGDALCYHLELPKLFLQRGSLLDLPYHENASYPLLCEMWYLWALALDGGVAAQLVHYSLGILLAASAALVARPYLGKRWARLAGAAVLIVPGITNQMTAPLNDVALAFLATMAVAGWQGARQANAPSGYAILCGVALGGAFGTKYTAIVFAVACLPVLLGDLFTGEYSPTRTWQSAITVLLVAGLVGGGWYLRTASQRGNPVYPFLTVLGGDQAPEKDPALKRPLGNDLVNVVTSPWQLTMNPETFGGRGHQLGMFGLALVPGCLFLRRLRPLRELLIVGAAYWLLWFVLRQNVRFLFPLVPLICTCGVGTLMVIRQMPPEPRAIASWALAMLLIFQVAIPVYRARHHLAVALGLQSRGEYLLRHEPVFEMAQVVNKELPRDSRILSQEYRAFYFRVPVTRENAFRHEENYQKFVKRSGDLSRVLREVGFTHLLLAESAGPGIRYDDTLSQMVDAQLVTQERERRTRPQDGDVRVVHTTRFTDSDGTKRQYRLVELR